MYGFDQGFDVYDESIVKEGLFDSLKGATSPESTRLVTDWLEGWSGQGGKKPFFVFLHLWDVHYDYRPPPPYDTMFDPGYDGPITGDDFLFDPNIKQGMPERDYRHLLALYDGEIRWVDEHVGKVVELLRRLGVLDDTIVVVTSDHGEEFLEHGRKGHGETLYDEAILVPLVVRFPRGVARGRVVAEQVRLMDVAPTVLELAGVAQPDGFGTPAGTEHGATSLARAVAPDDPADVPALVAFATTTMGKTTRSGMRRPDAKLVVQSPGPPRPEVYDLKRDPHERTNLARGAAAPELVRGLEEQLAAWQSAWHGHESLASALEIPPDQAARLRALGYID
jgi:arylsulfatase A-like enzyme